MDFLFGKPERTTSTQITTQQLPEEIRPGAKKVIDDAIKLYEGRTKRGRARFGVTTVPDPDDPTKMIEVGEEKSTIADLGKDELDAIAGLKSLVGTQTPYIDQYEKDIGVYKDDIGDIDIEFTADVADKFASPYLSAVLDVQKRKAQEDFQQRVLPQFEKQAVSAGGMSGLGSRAGVQASLLGDAFSRQLGDIEAIGREKAFQDAYGKFKDEGSRRRTIAGDLLDASGMARDIGKERLDTGLAEFGLLKSLGEEDREFRQARLSEDYARFLEEDEFIPTELARLSGFVTGSPFTKAISKTERTTKPSATPTQQVFGLGLEGLRDRRPRRPTGFGPGGGVSPFLFSAEGGQVSRKMGGGLASALPLVKRSMAGKAANQGYRIMDNQEVVLIPGTGLGQKALEIGSKGLGLTSQQEKNVKFRGTLELAKQQETANIAQKALDGFKQRSSKALDNIKKRDKKFLEELGKINKDTLDIINPEAAKQIIDPKEAGITAAQNAVLDEDAGRFGAVGLLALTMSKYAEGESQAEKDQYKLVRKAAIDTATLKQKQLKEQDLRQKGQDEKADKIAAEIANLKTTIANTEANIPTNVVKAIDTASDGLLKKQKTIAEIDAQKAKAAKDRKGTPSKGAAFTSNLRQGLDSVVSQYGYRITADGDIGLIEGRTALSQNSPAFREMIKRKNEYERLYLQKLKELGPTSTENQRDAMIFASGELAKRPSQFAATSPTTLAEFKNTLRTQKARDNFTNILIPRLKDQIKGKTNRQKKIAIAKKAKELKISVKILNEALNES